MPWFDPEHKRVVVRVVYDGPGHAGKTTNLQRLCKSFASWRRSDLVSPNTVGERTQYFDWLEVDGGVLQGYPIRAQLLTVPGQLELRMRRQFVIERADVIVFVSDSQPGAVAHSRRFYTQLCELLDGLEHELPIVFQANKQDIKGAINPRKLAREVTQGLRKPSMVKSSVATTNRGVKQTLNVALRLASEGARKRWKGQDLRKQLGEVADADTTLAAIEHREAQRDSGHAPVTDPSLPSPKLPSVQLWPSASARTLLQRMFGKHEVEGEQTSSAPHLQRIHFAEHPERYCLEGRADGERWRLTTGSHRRFDELEAALESMRQLANRRLNLGSWLPEPFAAAVVADDAGAWLWTIEPVLDSYAAAFESLDPERDAERLRELLVRMCEVAVGAEGLAERPGLLVEFDPVHFGEQHDGRPRTRYFGHELRPAAETEVLDIAAPLLALASRFEADEVALAELSEVLCLGLHHVPRAPERRAALSQRFAALELGSRKLARIRDAARMVLRRPAAADHDNAPDVDHPET